MQKAIKTMVENIKKSIIRDTRDVNSIEGYNTLRMVLAAYNAYQEEERDGVDYIFNIDNQDDLKCCVDGGLTAKEICGLWRGSQMNHTQFFFYGCNYSEPQTINSLGELRINLICWLEEVLECVVKYPYARDEYKAVYERYVTCAIEDSKDEMPTDLDVLIQLKAMLEAED